MLQHRVYGCMKYTSILPFVCVFLGLSQVLFGQEEDLNQEEYVERLTILDAGFTIADPLFPFNRHAQGVMYGAELGAYFQLNADHPYAIGLDLSYHYIDGHSVFFTDNIDGEIVDLEEKAYTNVASFLPSLRFYPQVNLGKIRPYVQLSLGGKLFFTNIRLTDTDGGDFVNENDIEGTSFSWTYGGGIGAHIELGSFVWLNFRATALPGVSTEFYRKLDDEDIPETDFAIDGFEKVNTTTPMMRYSIGVSFMIW